MAEPLGELDIIISGDFSGLQEAINQAASIAADGAAKIGEAFNSAASSGAADAFNQIGQAASGAAQEIQIFGSSAASSFTDLNAQLAQFNSTGLDQLSASVVNIATALGGLGPLFDQLSSSAKGLADAAPGVQQMADAMTQIKSAKPDLDGIGSSFSAITDAITAGAEALGLYELGKWILDQAQSFTEATQQIVANTGDIGDSLATLQGDFLNVFSQVPQSAADVGAALGLISSKLGEAGQQLDDLAKTLADISTITGASLDQLASKATSTFNQWQVATEDQIQELTNLLHVAEAAGVPLTQLLSQLNQFGPAAREMGLSLDQTAEMLGSLDQQGYNTQQVFMSLRQEINKLAKEDVPDAAASLQGWVDSIKNATTETEAMAIASTAGARGASALVDAIRSGALNFDDFAGKLNITTSSIHDQAEAAQTLSQAWSQALNAIDSDLGGALGSISNFLKTYLNGITQIFQTPKLAIEADITSLELVFLNAMDTMLKYAADHPIIAAMFGTSAVTGLASTMIDVENTIGALQTKQMDLAQAMAEASKNADTLNTSLNNLGGGGGGKGPVPQLGKDFDALGQSLEHAFDQAGALKDKIQQGLTDLSQGEHVNLQGLDNDYQAFINELNRSGIASTDFGKSLIDNLSDVKVALDSALNDQQWDKANAALQGVTDSLAKLDQANLDKVNLQIGNFIGTLSTFNDKHPFDAYTQALNTLGLTADGETKKMAADFAAFDEAVQGNASSLEKVEGAWAKIQTDISKLSKDPDGLSRVVSLTQEYGDYLAKADAPIAQQLAAWVQIYQAQLKAAEQDGASVTQITLIGEALDNAKAKQNAFTESSQGLLNLYTNVQKEFSAAWTSFGTGIGDAIAGTESFSTAFKNAISDMEKKLSELVVNYLLGQLKDAFLQNTDALSTFGKVFNSIFGVGGGPSSGASSAAGGVESLGFGAGQDTASKDLLGSVASSSEATASGITQMAGGIISELTSVVSLIGSIGQLITGIVQDFEQAHTNNLLDRIELSTRQTATFLGSGGGVLDYLNHILAAEVNESSAFTGWFHDAFASLMSTVEDIDTIDKQMLGMGLSAGGSGGGSGGSSPAPFDLGLPTTQGSSTVTADLGNATSSLSDSSASLATAAPTLAAASTSIGTAAQSLTVAAYSLSTSAAQNPANGSTAAPNFVNGPYATTSIIPQQLTENGQALANTMSLTVGGINVLGNSAQDLAAKIDALGGSLTAADRANALTLLGAAGPGASGNTLSSAIVQPGTPQLTPAQVQAMQNLVSTIPGQGFTGGGQSNTLSASPTFNLNFSGAHIYGSQGAQQFGTSLVNALKQNASLIKY